MRNVEMCCFQTWLSALTSSRCGRIASRFFSINSSAFMFMEWSRTGQRPRRAATEKKQRKKERARRQIQIQHFYTIPDESWGKIHSHTDGWMMSDYEDLHGQILCFSGVAPLAGRGANDTQRVQQDLRGNVAAPQLSQLSGFWHQHFLRQNLKVYSRQS